MTLWTRPRIGSLLAAIVAAAGLTAAAQAQAPAPAASAPLSAAIPPDPQISIGTFPNGLKYYIRTNKRPERRAELRLVVNVGSIVEDDDQLGLAHFVEHMAFNGTKNFAKQEIVAFMESIGMRFGPSLNAFTSFDETVYMLQVPDRQAGDPGEGIPDSRGLGAQRLVRSRRSRQGARRHRRGVAARAAAPAHAFRISSFRCCSKARVTPNGCRSARKRSSRRSNTNG